MPATSYAALEEAFDSARRIVVMTGAGLSTECGVPDFRSEGSPWLTYPPLPFADFMASAAMRLEGWRRKFAMDALYAGAQPGRGHRALAGFAQSGRIVGIITQNIDGLHQASGIPEGQLAELHGNGTYAACLVCNRRYELTFVRGEIATKACAPACDCGGYIKSATISFGQAMPQGPLRRAEGWARNCDLFLVIGSSLLVQPAASLPLVARQAGACLAILNRAPTPLDGMADIVLHAEAGAVLEKLHANCRNVPQKSTIGAVAKNP